MRIARPWIFQDTGRVSAHRGVVLFEAGHAVHAMVAPSGTPVKLAAGGMSEIVWAGDRGYAQIGGKIVEIR